MSDKPENFDSEKNPGIGIALAEVERGVMAHKELLGPPEIYAEVYNSISSAFLSGMAMVGRPLLPSDIYALQVIEGLAMQVIRPGSPALLSAARGAVIGAGMDIAAGMANAAAQKAQEAKEAEEAANVWDDTAPPAGEDKPAKPEDDAEEVAAVTQQNWVLNDGERLHEDAKFGDVVYARHSITGKTHRVGTVGAATGDGSRPIVYDKPAKPEVEGRMGYE